MVNPNINNEDFCARALASLNQQMALANSNTAAAVEIESYAKSLVEDDLPKIDSAVKSYLSLVAARSAVASDVDVLSASASSSLLASNAVQCTFASSAKSPMDANRCALMCARTLLSTTNSTKIPPKTFADGQRNDEAKIGDEELVKIELRRNATQILWNRLVQQSSSSTDGEKAKQSKPSKALGRESLHVAYPYIRERLRRGILLSDKDDATKPALQNDNPLHSLSKEALPPVNPPKGIDIEQWEAFYTEFGCLLDRACRSSNDGEEPPSSRSSAATSGAEDDSALLWSGDKGSAELRQRREARARRAAEALASTEGAKAAVTDAVLGSVAEE